METTEHSKAERSKSPVRVLMVCLGNICRSPTAHGVFQRRIDQAALQDKILVDSAGTGDYHIGEQPDSRAIEAASARGYELRTIRARQVAKKDFEIFDYILAMDRANLQAMNESCPPALAAKLELFLSYSESGQESVPDPYYSGADGFELVLDLVEDAADKLLVHILKQHFPNH
ncbi:MAG: low molecular weight protein-tyrosine-phosphatase [Gammaproteobacteria bacterium]|jgi:protein-tyrosine phosphatase|nr:phosphotyrosine protein phosphatase [Gammaproteobacteria bacterium]MDP6098205.1 low molecular weight protein-tyrosine-phosphatase [Gammaproteobacteria bacterium]HJO11705.1 low molecular weight protein-tyrosine-phosphatase [Gammaproteobacteria bacterium]|tara:strand:- start:4707 stop:5228 length:522 start_codon:yes stop_codon:yes gene_type:complete